MDSREGARGLSHGLGPNPPKTVGRAMLLVAYNSFRVKRNFTRKLKSNGDCIFCGRGGQVQRLNPRLSTL
jgi:hypothetical protein